MEENMAIQQMLPLVSEVPFDPGVATYTRFGTVFEAFEFTGWISESMSWKNTCFVGDWSPLAKAVIEGPDALLFFMKTAMNGFQKFDIGQAKHAVFCNTGGKVAGEGVLMRLAEEKFLLTGGVVVSWAQYQFEIGGYRSQFNDVTSDQCIIQVQGPSSIHVMERATGERLRDIGFMRFRKSCINDIEVIILRQGMAGEIGYEIHGRSDDAVAIYMHLMEVGAEFGIKRLGGRTKLVNHVEACFPTVTIDYLPAFHDSDEEGFRNWFSALGSAFTTVDIGHAGSFEVTHPRDLHRTPFELGWGKSARFDRDYIGREALEREAQNPKRKMVTLVWNSDDVINVYGSLFQRDETPFSYMEMPRNLAWCIWADDVLVGNRRVGLTTSRCYSYYFREMISLCVIDVEFSVPGAEVVVIWGNEGSPTKSIRAKVAPAPYKRDQRRSSFDDVPLLPLRVT
jgi:vanillate/3-O-methylgallate O-demethylase